jgi:hypothetical protein
MPYTLDFLTGAWSTEGGANWAANSLGSFVAPGHVTYDAETPNDPGWSARLQNVTPTVAGDVRLTGYVDPFAAAPQQAQLQVAKLSAPLGSGAYGYIALLSSTGGAAPVVLLLIVENDVPYIFDTQSSPAPLVDIGGIWLKVIPLSPTMISHEIFVKESGAWVSRLGGASTSGASTVPTSAAWIYNTDNGTPALTPQVYHANRVELTADGALV